MIKALVFDIDGVLIDSFDANLKFFQDLLSKAGYKPPTKKEYSPIFHLSMLDVIRICTKSSDEKEIKRVWEMGRSRKVKYPIFLLKTTKDLEKTIIELSGKYLLGIVTNRVKEGIYKIPVLSRLQKYFQITVAYQDTKNHKPHPDPLLLACKKLGVNPDEAVYVGDAQSDIIAGKAAGMKVIFFSQVINNNADATTSQFQKLPKLVESFNS
ncbi:MAG: HAD hydrolase, family IA, variant 1 [Candidatus Woesebacteria bacterium GW2011_GWA1_39_12]|uniref:HAD hydrolase, family IA, variant 1 n=1 Tax=Candidatus Woesebacteria bacterium GW2011_GWA1_39_12 TaxID=1618549 RepID=A0A0G0LW04_9BACT|nr:MAG: HAD hydrolase, family IA, variant 1 [Candidatus Woesebacteria bacterium GW2011_GWA1_39_12]